MKIGDTVIVKPEVRLASSDLYNYMPADSEGVILRAGGMDDYERVFEWTVYFPDLGGEWFFDARELMVVEERGG